MDDNSLQKTFVQGLTGDRAPPPLPSAGLPGPASRIAWMVYGITFVAFCSMMLSYTCGRGFWTTAAVLLGTMAVVMGLVLWLVFRWSQRNDNNMRQFSVASMFLVLLMVAAVLGMLRWFVDGDWTQGDLFPLNFPRSYRWITLGIWFTCVGPFGFWASLRMADSLLWLGVWLVRQRWIRKMLRRFTRSSASENPPSAVASPPHSDPN